MEFKFHEIIMSQVEDGICGNGASNDFKVNFTKGYLRNRIVDLREPDVELVSEVLINLLELFKCYSTDKKDSGRVEKLGRFIGMFVHCYESTSSSRREVYILEDILLEFLEELSVENLNS